MLDVTASVGVAALEYDDETPESILKRADQALYCAKRDGRNRVVADAA
jgi:two-component system cell cycle response regulator